jgi:hypothetical protein
MTKLACDDRRDCDSPVAYVDHKGYLYCECHGPKYKGDRPIRKLKSREIFALSNGQTIKY